MVLPMDSCTRILIKWCVKVNVWQLNLHISVYFHDYEPKCIYYWNYYLGYGAIMAAQHATVFPIGETVIQNTRIVLLFKMQLKYCIPKCNVKNWVSPTTKKCFGYV